MIGYFTPKRIAYGITVFCTAALVGIAVGAALS